MQAESAEALFLAKPPFADIPEAPLRIIVSFGSHVLVCRPNFMARHAYLLAKTLAEHAEGLPAPAGAPGGVVPAHRDRTLSSLAKRFRMIDGALVAGSARAIMARKLSCCGGIALAFLVLVLLVLGLRSPGAHETIDAEGVNAILAATDTAAARLKSVAGSAAEGEAMFALGMMQVEATAVLNRDLAAHSGQLTFNGQSLQKALAQRNLAPRFDDAIGRYRLPR